MRYYLACTLLITATAFQQPINNCGIAPLVRPTICFSSNDDTTTSTGSCQDYCDDNSKRRILQSFSAFPLLIPTIAEAMYTDKVTKIVLPEEGEIEAAVPKIFDVDDNPFEGMDKSAYSRLDKTSDSIFYKDPRFVEHVDENAVQLMTRYIADDVLEDKDVVLDLCTSWTSHMDQATLDKFNIQRVSGLGMNEEEMKGNPILHDYAVVDLNANENVKLPYDDESFTKVICQLSIDYLIHPLQVMKEVGRILKPGGKVVILFSNRLFIQKAVGLWTGKDDVDHVYTVGSYLNYSNGGFVNIRAKDLSSRKKKKIVGDPMYAVIAEKVK